MWIEDGMMFKATLAEIPKLRPGVTFTYRPMGYLDNLEMERNCKTPEEKLVHVAGRITDAWSALPGGNVAVQLTAERMKRMNPTLVMDIIGIVTGMVQATELEVIRKN